MNSSATETTKFDKLTIFAMILAAIGLTVSVYGLFHHLDVKATGSSDAFCNINDMFNCDDVARSAYSELFGFPLGVFGSGFFLGLLFLMIAGVKFPQHAAINRTGYGYSVLTGVVVSVILAGISQFVLGTFCLTCIGIYAVSVAQLGLVIAFRSDINWSPSGESANNTLTYMVGALGACILVYNLFIAPVYEVPSRLDGRQVAEKLGGPGNRPELLSKVAQEIKVARSAFSGYGEDYRKGPDSAPVQIIEFADFQCPACARASGVLHQAVGRFGDRIQVVFRNYPLSSRCNESVNRDIHPYACQAAQLGRCVGLRGNFWPYHDFVFANQRNLSPETLREAARSFGLSDAEYDACLASKDHLAKVKEDISAANAAGVQATPTIYLNGRKYLGNLDLGTLGLQIEELLNK